ncbi:MAG: nucleoside-diphosphate sugar epimerase/dehydratase [Pseudomonadota bacterium]
MLRNIAHIPRAYKQVLTLVFDITAVAVGLTIAIALRMGESWPAETIERSLPLYPVMAGLSIAISLVLGTHSLRLSALDLGSIGRLGQHALILALAGTAVNWVGHLGAPRSVPLIFGLILFCLTTFGRLGLLHALTWLIHLGQERTPVAVYGAGAAGVQLLSALGKSPEMRVVAVVDDNPGLEGVIIGGRRVQAPAALTALAQSGRIKRILLALPSAPPFRRKEIVAGLESLPCDVQAMPGLADMVENGDVLTSLKPVSSDDLLGRGAVDLDGPDIAKAYAGRAVLITGAGGSIGSELCRQMLHCRARRIVLFDHSEFALYRIDREIRPLAELTGTEVATMLGSVTDQQRVAQVLEEHGIEIVLHAAAYKHVPLVEENELEGARNNVFGTQILAEAARAADVERFILISTDKAVRPTNVMGATKRLAEMVIQDLQNRSDRTRFAMVRFGNVLDSSGSVIPLFREQIAAGGPVTLTHRDVTRFFMTVPEAARLVLLAGSYARGGDVFVLDMGQPMKIIDLARRMIELSGRTVKSPSNPGGDIEIAVTGLRPGEKLYEELLIGDDTLPTPHPKILRAEEACPSQIEMAGLMRELIQAMEQQAPEKVRQLIGRWVEGYHYEETGQRLQVAD